MHIYSSVRTSQRTNSFSIVETDEVMMFRKMFSIRAQNHT